MMQDVKDEAERSRQEGGKFAYRTYTVKKTVIEGPVMPNTGQKLQKSERNS